MAASAPQQRGQGKSKSSSVWVPVVVAAAFTGAATAAGAGCSVLPCGAGGSDAISLVADVLAGEADAAIDCGAVGASGTVARTGAGRVAGEGMPKCKGLTSSSGCHNGLRSGGGRPGGGHGQLGAPAWWPLPAGKGSGAGSLTERMGGTPGHVEWATAVLWAASSPYTSCNRVFWSWQGMAVKGASATTGAPTVTPHRESHAARRSRLSWRLGVCFSCGKWQKVQREPLWQRPFGKKLQRLQVPAACSAEPTDGSGPSCCARAAPCTIAGAGWAPGVTGTRPSASATACSPSESLSEAAWLSSLALSGLPSSLVSSRISINVLRFGRSGTAVPAGTSGTADDTFSDPS
mmetsp:Transcript_2053/g.6212  ORF Transcript_2053/g.6212 Transcript_2053/m.6212 type:complete len:348 (-) Transcript_2053:291-1334(-)